MRAQPARVMATWSVSSDVSASRLIAERHRLWRNHLDE
jgi:hypothetical protein